MTKLFAILPLAVLISIGCSDNKSVAPIKTSVPEEKIIPRPHKVQGFDGSTIIVIPRSDGNFYFYRDKDNDGLADTRGEGFYMFDLSRRTREEPLSPKEKMGSITKQYGIN